MEVLSGGNLELYRMYSIPQPFAREDINKQMLEIDGLYKEKDLFAFLNHKISVTELLARKQPAMDDNSKQIYD